MEKYCDEHVCVCLSARISPEPHARSLPIFLYIVAYVRGSVLLQQGDEIPREMGSFRGFFLLDNVCTAEHLGTIQNDGTDRDAVWDGDLGMP